MSLNRQTKIFKKIVLFMVEACLLHITEAWSAHSVRGFPSSLQRGGVVFGFRAGGGKFQRFLNKLKIGILSSPSCGKFITAGNLPEDGWYWSYCLHDSMKNKLRYKEGGRAMQPWTPQYSVPPRNPVRTLQKTVQKITF